MQARKPSDFFHYHAPELHQTSRIRLLQPSHPKHSDDTRVPTSSRSSSNDFVVPDHTAVLLRNLSAPPPTLPSAAACHKPSFPPLIEDGHTQMLKNVRGRGASACTGRARYGLVQSTALDSLEFGMPSRTLVCICEPPKQRRKAVRARKTGERELNGGKWSKEGRKGGKRKN